MCKYCAHITWMQAQRKSNFLLFKIQLLENSVFHISIILHFRTTLCCSVNSSLEYQLDTLIHSFSWRGETSLLKLPIQRELPERLRANTWAGHAQAHIVKRLSWDNFASFLNLSFLTHNSGWNTLSSIPATQLKTLRKMTLICKINTISFHS